MIAEVSPSYTHTQLAPVNWYSADFVLLFWESARAEFAEEGFCAPPIIALSGRGNGCEDTGEREGGATIFSRGETISGGREGGAEEPTEGFSAGNWLGARSTMVRETFRFSAVLSGAAKPCGACDPAADGETICQYSDTA